MKLVKKLVLGAILALLLVAAAGGTEGTWGSSYKVFKQTCAARGGVIHGVSYGSTCSYDGGLTTVPARNPEWTATVADGTVARWLGDGKVTQEASGGTIVVACHDREGQRVPLWQELCARP